MKCVTKLIIFPDCMLQAATLESPEVYFLHRFKGNNVTDQ